MSAAWRSGWCSAGNPPMSHALCAGAAGELVCVCVCHEPAKPDLVAALARAVEAARNAAKVSPTPAPPPRSTTDESHERTNR